MSWQDYIDQQLMCTLPSGGQLSHAAIVGTDGGVWAQSESFPAITEEEIAALVKGFDDPSQLAQVGCLPPTAAPRRFNKPNRHAHPALVQFNLTQMRKGNWRVFIRRCTPLPQNGLRIGGEKYMLVAGEPGEVLRGKQGSGGCCFPIVQERDRAVQEPAASVLRATSHEHPSASLPSITCSWMHDKEDQDGNGGGHLRRGRAAR